MKPIKLLFLLLLVIGVIGGFYFLDDSPSTIARWQRYDNSRYGYTLKYPLSWVSEVNVGDGEYDQHMVSAGPDVSTLNISSIKTGGCCLVDISTQPVNPNSSVEILNRNANQIQTVTINNIPMKIFETQYGLQTNKTYIFTDPSGRNHFRITILQNHNSIVTHFSPLSPKPPEWATMEKIISTFQFTSDSRSTGLPPKLLRGCQSNDPDFCQFADRVSTVLVKNKFEKMADYSVNHTIRCGTPMIWSPCKGKQANDMATGYFITIFENDSAVVTKDELVNDIKTWYYDNQVNLFQNAISHQNYGQLVFFDSQQKNAIVFYATNTNGTWQIDSIQVGAYLWAGGLSRTEDL